jgi:hypothetical protein
VRLRGGRRREEGLGDRWGVHERSVGDRLGTGRVVDGHELFDELGVLVTDRSEVEGTDEIRVESEWRKKSGTRERTHWYQSLKTMVYSWSQEMSVRRVSLLGRMMNGVARPCGRRSEFARGEFRLEANGSNGGWLTSVYCPA